MTLRGYVKRGKSIDVAVENTAFKADKSEPRYHCEDTSKCLVWKSHRTITNRAGQNAEACWGSRSCVVKAKMETVALSSAEHLDLSWGRLFPLEGGEAGSQALQPLSWPVGQGRATAPKQHSLPQISMGHVARNPSVPNLGPGRPGHCLRTQAFLLLTCAQAECCGQCTPTETGLWEPRAWC